MAIRHGRNVGIFINGTDLSGDLNEISPNSEQELADVTAFGNVGHTLYPGLSKDVGTIQAIYNSTERAMFEGMIQLTPGYAAMIAFGSTVGDPAYATNEIMLKNNGIKSVVTDVNRASIGFDVDNYPFEDGRLLTSGKQTASPCNGGIPLNSAYNFGSPSGTTGIVAYLQFFSSTLGATQLSIRSSSTGAFAGEETTTCTFTTVSSSAGAFTQRIAVSGTVYQYSRLYSDGTNSGSATMAVAMKQY